MLKIIGIIIILGIVSLSFILIREQILTAKKRKQEQLRQEQLEQERLEQERLQRQEFTRFWP